MSERNTVGIQPWLPWPLAGRKWWTEPIPAERLAALRIGIGLVLLYDILGCYLPQAADFFGAGTLGSPEVFVAGRWHLRWTAWAWLDDPASFRWLLFAWAIAAGCLVIGCVPRVAAAWCWLSSVSFLGSNYYIHNSGDNVRTIACLYLMLSPCGAAWALSIARANRPDPVCVPPWPVRLLTIQLALIYFMNGCYKLGGPEWRDGTIMHWVHGNLGWTRVSYAWLPLPDWAIYVETWITLFWELFFPVLILLPSTRTVTLVLGVVFHLGTAATLQLGPFPFYMICLYLPFVPWERWGKSE